MQLDPKEVLAALRAKKLGTGQLVAAAHVTPTNVHRALSTGIVDDDAGRRIAVVLGLDRGETAKPATPPVGDRSVKEVLALVESGDWDAREALEAEMAREDPRKTLVSALTEILEDTPEEEE